MPILDQADPNSLDAIMARLAAARLGVAPTVASTGGPTDVLRPPVMGPTADVPPGAVPGMGMGEAAQAPPVAAPAPDAASGQMPGWMAGAQMPVGILNGAAAPAAPPMPAPSPIPVPLPQPRPQIAPAAPPPDAAATIPPAASLTVGEGKPVPETSLAGRLSKAAERFGQGINDHSTTLMALGSGLAGAPSIGAGISRGLAAAIPASQMDLKQQQQNQTVKALVARGLPADVAAAAATNPALLQQILPQIFGAKQLQHVTIKDRLGNEIPMTFDPSTGKYRTATGEAYGAAGASGTSSMGNPTKIGKEYLDTLDPMTRNEVMAFGEGRAPVTARNLQQMLPMVTQAYPGFDASKYPTMMATRKSYTSGKDFQETQALNTVSGHMLKLADAAEALPNTGVPLLNKGMNWFKDTFTGSPELTKFRNALVTTSNELAKAYHGGHVSDSSYSAFQKGINEAQTPAEMKAAIGEISGLLQSKIEAKESGYRSSMGDAPLPSEFKATNDEARHAFARINDWAHGIKPEAAAPAGAAPTQAPTAAPAVAKFATPADVQAAIAAKKLKSGDHFLDANGVLRTVP